MSTSKSKSTSTKLFVSIPWYKRWDVLPFVVMYGALFGSLFSSNLVKVLSLTAIPLVLLSHVALFLVAQWSMKLKCFLGYVEVNDVLKAEYVLVQPEVLASNQRLVKLRKESLERVTSVSIAQQKFSLEEFSFEFQKVIYEYLKVDNVFVKVAYPSNGKPKSYLASPGLASMTEYQFCLRKWGLNTFDIPIPAYIDLYLVSESFHINQHM